MRYADVRSGRAVLALLAFCATVLMILIMSNQNSTAHSGELHLPPQIPPKTSLSWVGCGISKTAFMSELAAAYSRKTGTEIKIEGGGATRGIRDPATLKSDLGGSCRHVLPSAEEENARLIPVGWDALVVITNPENPVEEITLEQLKLILTGQTKNWRALGGPEQKIHVVIQEQGFEGKISGVGLMIRELLFFNRNQDFTKDSSSVGDSGPVEEMVEQDTWAMGVTGFSSARRRPVKVLPLEGVRPSYENIAQGKYPLFRPLYLVVPKASSNRRPIEGFIAFALSDEGQEVLKRSGTVTLEDGAGLWEKYRKKMLDAGVRMGDY
jgi:phosphate transport system substrate-binding protein